jgi:hypothetical protein
MTEEMHSNIGSDTSSKQGNQKERPFWYAPSVFYRSPFIDTHYKKTCYIHNA